MIPDTQGHWALLIMTVLSSCLGRTVPWLGAWSDGYGFVFLFFVFPKWFLFLSFFLVFIKSFIITSRTLQ